MKYALLIYGAPLGAQTDRPISLAVQMSLNL
jgi:hypothetical protein